jgi:CysZ protein
MAQLPARATLAGPGFSSGVLALPRAFVELLRAPELWPLSLVPTLVFASLTAVFGAGAVFVGRPWVTARLPHAHGELARVGVGVAGWGFAVVVALVGWYVALALAPTLSASALERIVDVVERRVGAPARVPLGFWRELACGVRSLGGAICMTLPLSGLLWLVGVLVPAATPVTLPLSSLLGALLVAWGLFDYPLTLRGFGFRRRLALMQNHLPCVTGFGLACALLFWLPCCGVVLLPAGTVAATRLVCAILYSTPH